MTKLTPEVIADLREMVKANEGDDDVNAIVEYAREVVAAEDAKDKTFYVCVAATVEINEKVRAPTPTDASRIALERAAKKIISAEKRTALTNATLVDAHVTNPDGSKAVV
mgnify:CR=1 FL=1